MNIKNIKIKRKIFRNKNNFFNYHINNNQSIQNKMKNNDLNDDIYNNININNKSVNNLNEQNNQIISDYCSSYIENEKENKRKMFCYNNQINNKENNKINIQKNSLISKFEENKNNIIDDNKIINIVNKYKNNSIPNSRHLKNKKLKNLIFTYERLFNQQNPTFKPKINKKKFFNDDNKEDIGYKNNNKKVKVKYLTPNTTKDKKSVNFILESEKNKILYKENEKNNIKENNNNIKRNTYTNEKNLEFDLNMTQSKSILNNIKYETNSKNCFKKVKDFLDNNLPEKRNDKKIDSNIINNSISGEEKCKYKNIFGDLKKEKINNHKNYENSKNNETIDYNNNNSNKNNSNSENYSGSNKENSYYNLNIDMNNEYLKEINKPIIINSGSCLYDNYGHKIFNDFKRKEKENTDYIIKNNTINSNCTKRNKNYIRYNNIQNQGYKNKKKKYNCDKENNEDLNYIDSENLLLIKDITKCPKCHCLFGKSSKVINNKK